MIFEMKFEKSCFDDMPPEEKSSEELILLVMKIARGDIIKNRKYSHYDIDRAARKLVLEGFIRGTALDDNKCVWSRLTRRGQFWLEITERQQKYM
jgi:hypothetical protein